MELEFFVMPGTDAQWYDHWLQARVDWWTELGIHPENLHLHHKTGDDLAHYARAVCDIEFHFPFGWGELEGVANRGDFDLLQHETSSGEDLKVFDEDTKTRIRPEVIEPSAGVDRAVLAFLANAYDEEPDKDDVRVVLRLHQRLAPYKIAILPLQRKEPLVNLAHQIQSTLRARFMTVYDETGSIGRRYRRQDEIGTPYCITPDFESLEQGTITVRDRDSMSQVRLPAAELEPWLA